MANDDGDDDGDDDVVSIQYVHDNWGAWEHRSIGAEDKIISYERVVSLGQ